MWWIYLTFQMTLTPSLWFWKMFKAIGYRRANPPSQRRAEKKKSHSCGVSGTHHGHPWLNCHGSGIWRRCPENALAPFCTLLWFHVQTLILLLLSERILDFSFFFIQQKCILEDIDVVIIVYTENSRSTSSLLGV